MTTETTDSPQSGNLGDVNSNEPGSGARYNAGKPAYELVPLIALEDCAKVFDYGRQKYAPWNWAKGMPWSAPLGCLLRHLSAWQRGEDNDPESGLPHLGHAMANLVMLTTYARTYPKGDDRTEWLGAGAVQPPKDSERAAYLERWEGAPRDADWLTEDAQGVCYFWRGQPPRLDRLSNQQRWGADAGCESAGRGPNDMLGSVRCEPRPEVQR